MCSWLKKHKTQPASFANFCHFLITSCPREKRYQPLPTLPYWNQWKPGWGLGTRLHFPALYSYTSLPRKFSLGAVDVQWSVFLGVNHIINIHIISSDSVCKPCVTKHAMPISEVFMGSQLKPPHHF